MSQRGAKTYKFNRKVMKISVLTPNLSNNSLGRAWMLAKILQRHYEVEMIGPMFGSSIWEPVESEFSYISVKGRLFPQFIPEVYRMLRRIKGDVIYASKPLFTSFDIGLMKKFFARKPLVLDVDDWELPMCFRYHGRKNILYPNSYWSTLLNERLTHMADAITVSNRFLQRRFGGTIIYHARDTEYLDPLKYDGMSLKEKFGVAGNKIVAFLGTPRPHKGLEDLIRAIVTLQDKQVILMIMGLDKSRDAQNVRSMIEALLPKEQVLDLGIQPIHELPKFLSLTDLVVIPQRKTPESIGQIPARVFDAMAMAKPIIATRISDLPEILDGCGWVVEPENPRQLAQAIAKVFDNYEEARSIGERARVKCVTQYSYDAVEKVLDRAFNRFQ